MPKDSMERRSYRKSPGRQYEYEPVHNPSERSRSGRVENIEENERWSTHGTAGKRTSAPLTLRPDPRKTRQLLRQNIIASKARLVEEEDELLGQRDTEPQGQRITEEHGGEPYQERERYVTRGTRSGRLAQPRMPSTQELMEAGEEEWSELDAGPDVDPDLDYEDAFDEEPGYSEELPTRSGALSPIQEHAPYVRPGVPTRASRQLPPLRPADHEYEDEDDEYYEDERYEGYERDYEDDSSPARRSGRKRKVSRRGLLLGLGVVAVAGAGAAAYEYAPKIPQAIGETGANIERQVQEAFNKGLEQGTEAARKEFVTALENLEGFTLEGAVTAARLTRVAYDVFVSPVIQIGATVASDFLTAMLKSFKTARMLLAGVYQDNATLQAIQKVLESWVGQVTNMPKQLNAITQADLDGAQAYLRALQRKIDDEKKKLNNPTNPTNPTSSKVTPTPQPTAKSTSKPKQ